MDELGKVVSAERERGNGVLGFEGFQQSTTS